MNCDYHPDKESVGACSTCGRQLCEECREVLDGRFYCYTCYSGAVQFSGETSERGNVNWFERHLNWTMILAVIVFSIPASIAALISSASDSSMGPTIVLAFIWLLAVTMVWGWALKKKGRSLWWLLLCWFVPPFGLLIFFYLENRSQTSGEPPQPPQSQILH
jgi:hypothetical protein